MIQPDGEKMSVKLMVVMRARWVTADKTIESSVLLSVGFARSLVRCPDASAHSAG